MEDEYRSKAREVISKLFLATMIPAILGVGVLAIRYPVIGQIAGKYGTTAGGHGKIVSYVQEYQIPVSIILYIGLYIVGSIQAGKMVESLYVKVKTKGEN